jgi:EEF1A N-terminal glycine/lysine methyltransferase
MATTWLIAAASIEPRKKKQKKPRMSSDDCEFNVALFDEPETYFEPEKSAKWLKVQVGDAQHFRLRLIGSHVLWAHHLWNASQVMSELLLGLRPSQLFALADGLDDDTLRSHLLAFDAAKKHCIELGAGAALPSLVCARNGASCVLATDYPDQCLIDNIEINRKENLADDGVFVARGFLWGKDMDEVAGADAKHTFDLVLLSDLLFNHSAHEAMLDSIDYFMAPSGRAIVAFSHHRPRYADRDLKFFELAAAAPYNLDVVKIGTVKMDPMFPEDEGSLEVRSTVHIYSLQRRSN